MKSQSDEIHRVDEIAGGDEGSLPPHRYAEKNTKNARCCRAFFIYYLMNLNKCRICELQAEVDQFTLLINSGTSDSGIPSTSENSVLMSFSALRIVFSSAM